MTALVLEPVDRVVVTTVVDNTADMVLPDVGLVRRWGLAGNAGPIPIVPSDVTIGGTTLDFVRAEHEFTGHREHRP